MIETGSYNIVFEDVDDNILELVINYIYLQRPARAGEKGRQ